MIGMGVKSFTCWGEGGMSWGREVNYPPSSSPESKKVT